MRPFSDAVHKGFRVEDQGLDRLLEELVRRANRAESVAHDRLHGLSSATDHEGLSGAVQNNLVAFDPNGLPKDSGATPSDFEDAGAVTTHESAYDHDKLHTRLHNLLSSSDHDASGTAAENDVIYRGASAWQNLAVAASRILGRKASGGVAAMTAAEVAAILFGTGVNGDVLYYNSGWLRLAKGSDGDVLTLASGIPAWTTPSAGASVVWRDDDSADYDFTSFTTDGAWHDLDLSSIVPAGATGVFLRVNLMENTAGRGFGVRKNGNSNIREAAWFTIQNATVPYTASAFCACDSNRVVEYWADNAVWTWINMHILGWTI